MPRLLIVKTSSLGDVIHNLPILADIRQHQPDMEFDWVVEESFTDIPALHPAVSSVIPVALRRWRQKPFSSATWHEIAAFRQRLRQTPYDLVLDTQGLLKSALITRSARGMRHGQNRLSAREPLAALFYDRRHFVPRGQHAVVRNRQLAALALGYPLPESLPDYGIRAPESGPAIALPDQYVVALHATSRDSKLWPAAHWVTLGQQLFEQGIYLLLPWGNATEQQRAQAIAAQVPQSIVLPRLRLTALAGILAKARAAIGVDTGLVHLAVALGVPTVAIYTDTDPLLTGVYPGASLVANLGGAGQIPDPGVVYNTLMDIVY